MSPVPGRKDLLVRSLILLLLAVWLCVASVALADDDGSEAQPAEEPAPSGPVLQPSDYAPLMCDSANSRFRYVEVRGTGFDAFALQRLVGTVVDEAGRPQAQWGSVWVSPQGRLTLEVNLCADPFRGRPALPAGTYTISVGQGAGQPIAATSFALSAPPEPVAEGEEGEPAAMVPLPAPPRANTAEPTTPPQPFTLPDIAPAPRPTPLPLPSLPTATDPAAAPGPRTGPGSRQQPFAQGAPAALADGWRLLVTGVTPDAWDGIKAAVPSAIPPASDQRAYMVRVEASYLGQGTGVFSAMRLALLSGTQTTYDQLKNGCGVVPDMVPPNLVTQGGVVRGNVCFTVRSSDVDSLVMFDSQTADNDRLYFALR
jgi:hypothetical protein